MPILFESLGTQLAEPARKGDDEAVAKAVGLATLDTVAVMGQGGGTQVALGVGEFATTLASQGSSHIIGRGRCAPPLAALANATAAHSQDFDDATTVGVGGHVSAVVIPAALALCEEYSLSGARLVDAVAHGYEVECLIADAMNPDHYESGFHPTSTLGVFGACAVSARLLELPADIASHALSISASMSSGIKGNFGSMAKPLHCGWAAQAGISAAYLAQRGIRANTAAFEANQGYQQVYRGRPGHEGPAVETEYGQPWKIIEPGVTLRKMWPCCGSIHSAIEAATRLSDSIVDVEGEVSEVRAELHRRRLPHIDRPKPRTGMERRFSLQYCVASSLLNGRLGEEDFSDSAGISPATASMMERVHMSPAPGDATGRPAMGGSEFGAEVHVVLRNGDNLTERVAFPLGSPERPMARADLREKAARCMAGVRLSHSAKESYMDALLSVASIGDLSEFDWSHPWRGQI